MIPIEELRIGNYHFRGFQTENHIEKIAFAQDLCYHGFMFPIPLTEDILLKSGFIETYKEWLDCTVTPILFYKRPYFLTRLTQTQLTFAKMNDTGGEFLRNVEFVHQLQNVWYWLTGEELEIVL